MRGHLTHQNQGATPQLLEISLLEEQIPSYQKTAFRYQNYSVIRQKTTIMKGLAMVKAMEVPSFTHCSRHLTEGAETKENVREFEV
jgi:hypothetical protein